MNGSVELPLVTAADAAAALRDGSTTSRRLTLDAIAAADRLDGTLGIFLDRYVSEAIEAADAADRRFAAGSPLSPLDGIPIGVKDNTSTTEGPTTAQSLVFDPAGLSGDATVVARLRAAGAIVMGKTTTMEFALGVPDPSKPFPVPRNPWDPERWASGSSSGTGSGVAAGAFFAGIGSDTAGSIRGPAAACGVTGLKPTFGRVPRTGVIPAAYSLDHVGPLARSAEDVALLLSIMEGPDGEDPTVTEDAALDYAAALSGHLEGVRIGFDGLARFGGTHEDAAVPGSFAAALAVLEQAGAELVPIELPLYAELTAVSSVIGGSEAAAYHDPDVRSKFDDYFATTRLTLLTGSFFTAADYVQAQRVRRVGQKALSRVFEGVDLVVTPTIGMAAPRLDGMAEFMSEQFSTVYTPYWNAVGNPALSVPMAPNAEGLPLGLQIAGRPHEDDVVLRAGDAFQRRSSYHRLIPPLVTRAVVDTEEVAR
jgi:aspartyl-tRNA(Asn)/glutamyl-tRNA(Gln) amidotransferase subunit A